MERADDDDENDGGMMDNGGAMSSMLLSFYGMDSASGGPNLIDSAHFEPDVFVKELLTTLPLEGLIAKDNSMVHEIRALDGDMQMLVYENYNKFISATETIKRMKNNVDAMDDDMEDVRIKMEKIAKTSRRLDGNLADNRSKVDKLVRVRRLLSRLEFLSELPEKLAEMISKEHYKEAVQLYSKTIKVLTSHSHVLSFKNIKERTERMMQDLRGRVMDLLDDPALEAVKLTQHVTVLRLMEAPRDKVVEKLLAAHRHRTTRMTKQYQQQLSMVMVNTVASDTTVVGNHDLAGSVSSARKFHQSLMVGLIEACKGIAELFTDVVSDNRERSSSSVGGNDMTMATVVRRNMSDADDGMSTSTAAGGAAGGGGGGMTRHHQSLTESMVSDAYHQLQSCLTNLMQEYTKCLVNSFQLFFERFDAHILACEMLEKDKEGEREQPTLSRSAQLRTYELEEEHQGWMMLARQAILDCQYLDKAAIECAPVLLGGNVGTISVPIRAAHASTFATSILTVLEAHNEASFRRRIFGLLTMLTKQAALGLAPVCQMIPHSATPTTPRKGDHAAFPDPYMARTAVQQRSVQAKTQLDTMNEVFASCFADICSDYKPIIEIHTVHAASSSSSSSSSSNNKNTNINGLRTRSSSNATAAVNDKSSSTSICHSSLLVEKFVQTICHATETLAGVDVGFHLFTSNNGSNHGNMNGDENNTTDDIYTESDTKEGTKFGMDCSSLLPLLEDMDVRLNVLHFFGIVASVVMRRLAPILCKRLNAELQIQELDHITTNAPLRDRCQRRVETCADKLLASFVETNAYHRAHQLTLALFAQDSSHPNSPSSHHHNPHHNPSLMIDFAVGLDALAVVCCVLLAEAPPPPKFSSVSVERDLNRIRSGAIAARQNRGGARAGLQLDIDRLFAQQIRVFEGASLTSPTLDAVLGTVLKASFKSAQEYSRLHTFYGADRNHHCLLVQAEMTFVKQCASAVLRDSSACDALVDQVLSGLAARQADKEGSLEELPRIGSSSHDSHDDVISMSRIVNDRLASICTRSVLLPRS